MTKNRQMSISINLISYIYTMNYKYFAAGSIRNIFFQNPTERNILISSLPSSSSSLVPSTLKHQNISRNTNKNNVIIIQKRSADRTMASHLCQIDCKKEKRRPVCGMDNVTYESRCDLHQTICRGKQVRLQYRGECSQRKFMSY